MKLDVLLSQAEIRALEAKALSAAINEAVRAYLRSHTGPDKPLPFHAANGEERYQLGTEVGTICWTAPSDLEKRLVWNGETARHVRAAIRAYIAPPPTLTHEPKPIPKEERPRIEIQISKTALAKARRQAEKRGIDLETLFVDVCRNYAKEIADDTGRPKLLMCKLPDVTNSTTWLRFKAPDSIWRITTNDPALASRFVSEALDRRFGDWS